LLGSTLHLQKGADLLKPDFSSHDRFRRSIHSPAIQ